MKPSVIVPLFLLAIGAVTGLIAADKEPAKPSTGAEATLGKVAADLKEARSLLKSVTDRKVREKLELLLGRSELSIKELQADLAKSVPVKAMPAEDFAKVLKGLKDQSFDDGKTKYVAALPRTARFTSAQVKQMLATFSFDRDRVTAAVALHPLVTDPELFVTVLDSFTFKSSKDEVLSKIKPK